MTKQVDGYGHTKLLIDIRIVEALQLGTRSNR